MSKRGIPYSMREAELAAKKLPMDEYVRDLLRFLLRRVRRLEKKIAKKAAEDALEDRPI